MNLSERIRSELEARILSGEWKPGHPIPAEHALMATYGCARMTVNKAIAGMAAAAAVALLPTCTFFEPIERKTQDLRFHWRGPIDSRASPRKICAWSRGRGLITSRLSVLA